MMNYISIKLKNSCYDYLLIATTYENPVNQFLFDNSIDFMNAGKIAFDLTVVNGKKFNRYAFADVENHKIIPQSISVSDSADKIISNASKEYFSEHLDIIEKSILPKACKFELIKEFTNL